MLSGQRDQCPLAVPCIRFVPWAALASCRPLRLKVLPGQQAVQLVVRAAGSVPSCGALHPLRALGGTRVLQTAAPKIAPCFCRRQRSQF